MNFNTANSGVEVEGSSMGAISAFIQNFGLSENFLQIADTEKCSVAINFQPSR